MLKKEIKEEKPRAKEKKAKTDMKGLTEKWLQKINGELKNELSVRNKEASFIIAMQ